jgi:hypothetical protein
MVLAVVTDPDGRRVELNRERWEHILEPERHPELAQYLDDILRTIEKPDQQLPGNEADEIRFAAEHVGPSRWLQVVVVFGSDRAFVVTAFASRRLRK